MMEWTRVKPSQEGWYWWRSVDKCAARIVYIMLAGQGNRERWCVLDEGDMEDLHSYSGEWSSKPIAEPKENS